MMLQSSTLTVSELTNKIKSTLESSFVNIKIQGEISNFKLHTSGHLYFDIKDSQAKISAVMFKRQTATLRKLPKEGDEIIVMASVNVYPPHGKYQLMVETLEFVGTGALLLQLEELKKKLKTLGWFEKERKKPLPLFPKVIGVVTSPTGAVIRDIINVLRRRHSGFHLILNPVRVQGKEAAAEIALAIEEFNQFKLADVLIVGRGGGSLEDLWCFNEERVASAIYHSTIPIVSAVGHETDFTIADFVADLRAPTPSAAAEIVTAEKKEKIIWLQKLRLNIHQTQLQLVKRYRMRLSAIQKHPFWANPRLLLSQPLQRLDEQRVRLDQMMKGHLIKQRAALTAYQREVALAAPKQKLAHSKESLKRLSQSNDLAITRKMSLQKERLIQITTQLKALDPKNVLKRGYAILFAEKEKSVVVSTKDLHKGKRINALLADGQSYLEVIE